MPNRRLCFAPPTSFLDTLLEVEVFFYVAIASKLISSKRASNWLDMTYLFYLPFCMMFVSNDRLHQRSAPFFLRPDQEFVWGPQLKENLAEINGHYLSHAEFHERSGVLSWADPPPVVGNQKVNNLWNRLLAKARESFGSPYNKTDRRPPSAAEITQMANSPELQNGFDSTSGHINQGIFKRNVRSKKGSWHQVPGAIRR